MAFIKNCFAGLRGWIALFVSFLQFFTYSLTELPATFLHLKQFLAEGGVFVVSFKYGDSERVKDGRAFTDMNEARLAEVIGQVAGLEVRETWVTGDNRVGVDGRCLNAVLG